MNTTEEHQVRKVTLKEQLFNAIWDYYFNQFQIVLESITTYCDNFSSKNQELFCIAALQHLIDVFSNGGPRVYDCFQIIMDEQKCEE